MLNLILGGFPFFIFLLIAGLVVYFSYQSAKKRIEVLKITAKSLGLNFIQDSVPEIMPNSNSENSVVNKLRLYAVYFSKWRIQGNISGGKVDIFYETRGSGKNSQVYTIIDLYPDQKLNFDLELYKQGFFTTIGINLFGMKDIEIGDERFDKLFRVIGQDENSIKLYLKNPLRQKALFDLFETEEYKVFQNKIHFEKNVQLSSLEEIQPRLEKMKTASLKFYGLANESVF